MSNPLEPIRRRGTVRQRNKREKKREARALRFANDPTPAERAAPTGLKIVKTKVVRPAADGTLEVVGERKSWQWR